MQSLHIQLDMTSEDICLKNAAKPLQLHIQAISKLVLQSAAYLHMHT